jgi:hypothetical protein
MQANGLEDATLDVAGEGPTPSATRVARLDSSHALDAAEAREQTAALTALDQPMPISLTVQEVPEDREQLTTTTMSDQLEVTSLPVKEVPEAGEHPALTLPASTGPPGWQEILATARLEEGHGRLGEGRLGEGSFPAFIDPFQNSLLNPTHPLPGLYPRRPDQSPDFLTFALNLSLFNYLITPHRAIQPAPPCGVAGVYPFQFPANMLPAEHGWTDLDDIAKQCVEGRKRVDGVRKAVGVKRVMAKDCYDVQMVSREIYRNA